MPRFHFQKFDIAKIEKSSAFFQSLRNKPFDWKSYKKENQSFGEVNGKEVLLKELLIINEDDDTLDLTFHKKKKNE